MAENEREDEIGRRYRELAREEPPRALDESILAAARRELETRPAPLVAPTGRRRWMFPVAAAAVIVLSAVVTLHMQREQPDLELATAPPPSAPTAGVKAEKEGAPADARVARESVDAQPRRDERRAAGPTPPPALSDRAQSKAAEARRRFTPDPAAAAPPAQKPMPQIAEQAAPAPAAAPATVPAPAAVPAPERDTAEMSRQALSRRAESMMAKSEAVGEPPERMLERIATLRREGRHKEADDLYAEFRRRFPEYRIPQAMREQVLPR